jgi:hypothetical protein
MNVNTLRRATCANPFQSTAEHIDSLARLLDGQGLQALLEALELLAQECASDPAYSSWHAPLWTSAANELNNAA